MPRSKAEDEAAGAAAPAEDRPPGKPASQVEAEAPPDAETAVIWQAEYESRMPGTTAVTSAGT